MFRSFVASGGRAIKSVGLFCILGLGLLLVNLVLDIESADVFFMSLRLCAYVYFFYWFNTKIRNCDLDQPTDRTDDIKRKRALTRVISLFVIIIIFFEYQTAQVSGWL